MGRRARAVCDGVDEGAMGALDPASPMSEFRHRNNPAHSRGQEVIPTLIIEKAAPGEYFVGVRYEHSVVQVYTVASIHEAIGEAVTLIPSAYAFHIWLEHVSM